MAGIALENMVTGQWFVATFEGNFRLVRVEDEGRIDGVVFEPIQCGESVRMERWASGTCFLRRLASGSRICPSTSYWTPAPDAIKADEPTIVERS